ncbi:MAG: YHS domain-containing protein [Dehalococcoidia bacterium]|nr:YHS domain-containing protein [Dehalococcoidia bacterium]MYA52197.1 YHS domain-containing protein [Dehalococcoidia bacterium]
MTGHVAGGAPERASGMGAKRFYRGRWYYFCSLECRLKFMATPDEFIEGAGPPP